MSPPILVTGATGNTGGATVEALRSRGVPVRAVSRSAREWPEGVEGVVGDLDDAATLIDAARGVAGAYLLSGYAGLEDLLAALADGGTQRVTLLSSSAAPGRATTTPWPPTTSPRSSSCATPASPGRSCSRTRS